MKFCKSTFHLPKLTIFQLVPIIPDTKLVNKFRSRTHTHIYIHIDRNVNIYKFYKHTPVTSPKSLLGGLGKLCQWIKVLGLKVSSRLNLQNDNISLILLPNMILGQFMN